ncbi:FAD-binding protein [Paraburkholderia sp.]|uniref:FAD-dependent oxidoreductase n=1 Tax=Paraburkholderia sp. TaxID=1926495 RepID=UPI0039E4C907
MLPGDIATKETVIVNLKSKPVHLVVIGGGMAGLVAAVRGVEAGMKVTLVEKGATDQYPCNARMSGGLFHLGFSDVSLPPDELVSIIETRTGGATDPQLATTLARGGLALVDWLRGHGVRFMRPPSPWQFWTAAPPRSLGPGQDWKGRGPDVLLRQLALAFRKLGGTMLMQTTITGLRMTQGRCHGVDGVGPSGAMQIDADAVIICDGGFQGNLEMLREHVSPAPERLKQRGASTGTGDGLRMAMAVGAATSRLDSFYGHLLSRDAMTNDNLWPYPELDALAVSGILVNAEGTRFADEGRGGIYLANSVARLSDPLSATIVIDATIWATAGRAARIPANPHIVNGGATIHQASDIAGLATKAGLPREQLEQTVRTHNDAVRRSSLNELSPARTPGLRPAAPIAQAPFMAIPVCAGITYTMGGIRVNEHAQVLKTNGEPIEGLYAAGTAVGGVDGGDFCGYVGGLVSSGVLATAAVEAVGKRVA